VNKKNRVASQVMASALDAKYREQFAAFKSTRETSQDVGDHKVNAGEVSI